VFEGRLRRGVESSENRLTGGEGGKLSRVDYKLVEKIRESKNVFGLALERVEKDKDPKDVLLGSHVRLRLGNG
jgi:NAD(P)H-flavin reductase